MAGPAQIPDLRIQEEIMRRQRELLNIGMREVKRKEEKIAAIKEAKPHLNIHNQKYLENFEKNVDNIKVYKDEKMAVFVDLRNRRLLEITSTGPKKTNVERWEVKQPQPAQVTQIIPAKDLSNQISWDTGEKFKPSPQQEVKLKDTLTASATSSQIKEPLPAIIEPKELDAKPMPKVNNKACLEKTDSLINVLSNASQLLQSKLERSFDNKRMKNVEKLERDMSSKPMETAAKIISPVIGPFGAAKEQKEARKAAWELVTKPATESLRVLFGVYDAKMSTYEAYQTDINDKSIGLRYIKSFLSKGKTLDDMQKMTSKEFKDEKEFGKFNNALKFLGSNLKDESRIYNYIGDVASHLGMYDLAASGYDAAKNSVMLENVQHMKIMSVVSDLVDSSTSATGIAALNAGTLLLQIGTPIWKGADALLSKLPEVKKAMQTLEASKVCFHSTNAEGLAGIVKEGKIIMSGTKFTGATEEVTGGVWTSVGKPMLNTVADYSFSFELKNAPALEQNAVKIWDLFGGRRFLTMGVKNDIALAENWTGRMFVANEQKAIEAINILKTTGMDTSKVQFLVVGKTISNTAGLQVATRLTGDTGWIMHDLFPASMCTFFNYVGQK